MSEDGETVNMQEVAEKRAEMAESAEQRIDLTVGSKDSDVLNSGDSAIHRNKEGLKSRRRSAKVRINYYATCMFLLDSSYCECCLSLSSAGASFVRKLQTLFFFVLFDSSHWCSYGQLTKFGGFCCLFSIVFV